MRALRPALLQHFTILVAFILLAKAKSVTLELVPDPINVTVPKRNCVFIGCQAETARPCSGQPEHTELSSSVLCFDHDIYNGTVNYLCCEKRLSVNLESNLMLLKKLYAHFEKQNNIN